MVFDRSDGIHWRVVFAIAGLVFGVAIGVAGTALYYSERQQQKTVAADAYFRNYDKRPQQNLTPRSGIPATVESAISNPQPSTGQDHEKRDLAAQEASAAFAWWMVVVSFLGFVVTTIGTILLYKQIRLTREAVKDTGDATKAMQAANTFAKKAAKDEKVREYRLSRPCIGVEKVEIASSDPGTVTYRAVIKNFGQTPAHNVQYSAKIARRKELCPDDLDWSYTYPQFLAPTQTLGLPVVVDRSQLQSPGDVYLVMEIRYTDTLGGVWILQQRYFTTDRKEWYTDEKGNGETLRRPPKIS